MSGKFGLKFFTLVFFVALVKAQRNLQYPTTIKPAVTESTQPSTTTEFDATTTELPTTTDYAPYPAAGFRPGKAFDLPSDKGQPVDIPNEVPIDDGSYPTAGFQPNPSFDLPTEVDQNMDELGSGFDSRSEFDLVPAASEFTATIRFPDEEDNRNDNLARIMSGQGVLQTRPSGFHHHHYQEVPEHRFLRPGPSFSDNRVTKVVMLRPNQSRRPIRPLNRPVTGAQTTLQTRPSFGGNPGFIYEEQPVLITTIRLPDPFAFTRFLDTF